MLTKVSSTNQSIWFTRILGHIPVWLMISYQYYFLLLMHNTRFNLFYKFIFQSLIGAIYCNLLSIPEKALVRGKWCCSHAHQCHLVRESSYILYIQKTLHCIDIVASEKRRNLPLGLPIHFSITYFVCPEGSLLFPLLSADNLEGYMAMLSNFLFASHISSLKPKYIVKGTKISLGIIWRESGLVMPRWWLSGSRKNSAGDTEDTARRLGGLGIQKPFPRVQKTGIQIRLTSYCNFL